MLARYKIHRGKSPEGESLPDGIRQDTRKHTRHCLRPGAEDVAEYLADVSDEAWEKFAASYNRKVEQRWAADREPFDRLADLAESENVYIGCSCPTKKNPDVMRCHTVLALAFMKERYPGLEVMFP